MGFLCPVCGETLIEGDKSLVCVNEHLFDKAKKGYVNLLLGRDGSLHGDSKQMALSRFEIMQAGLYAPLQQLIVQCLQAHLERPRCIADCGCGECYYTAAVQQAFPHAEILATDISKEALAVANRRSTPVKRAVASSFSLPVASESCDAALNIFSPFAKEEYTRILKPGGVLLMVIPLENHLWELKQAVYEEPYKNAPKDTALEGFTLRAQSECRYRRQCDTAQLRQLFFMTPYSFKTAPEDIKKLDTIPTLEVSFCFKILVYTKE